FKRLLNSAARLVAIRLCWGVPPAIANTSPSKNSLLNSAARSISRYSDCVNRRNVWGNDIAIPNVNVSPDQGKRPWTNGFNERRLHRRQRTLGAQNGRAASTRRALDRPFAPW